MDRETAVALLREQNGNSDVGIAHSTADEILCRFLISLGYNDVVEAWEGVEKWYA